MKRNETIGGSWLEWGTSGYDCHMEGSVLAQNKRLSIRVFQISRTGTLTGDKTAFQKLDCTHFGRGSSIVLLISPYIITGFSMFILFYILSQLFWISWLLPIMMISAT